MFRSLCRSSRSLIRRTTSSGAPFGTTAIARTTTAATNSSSSAGRCYYASSSASHRQQQQESSPTALPSPEDMPFAHHGKRPRFRNYTKFKSPRKRASKLLEEITGESVARSKESRPKVWEAPFRVGDAVEIKMVAQGGVGSRKLEKIRGVVLGIYRKRLDTSVLIRDVVHGLPVERRGELAQLRHAVVLLTSL